ncbi:MAG: ectonucleotide pyrophosphatase/phosphodiesterase [Terracidiphilus sp.]|jgi:predicted AlkP superfamily pyrophosphatase or phosphodiesterase
MNRVIRCLIVKLVPVLLLVSALIQSSHAAPVLMISIDGLKPEYVTQADAHGMKVPYLRTLIRDGVYAEGVVGVWPTVTYPSHTTLVTGVSPAEHGIYSNLEFDPEQRYSGAWNWYAAQIRVPTLWQVAHQAGLRTASVGWPVSVGATDVDYLIPEYWRGVDASSGSNPADRYLMAGLSRPGTLLKQLEPAAGEYMMGNDTSIGGDEIKIRYSVEILRTLKPAFMTIHLSSLDETEHAHGPFSAEANADLESIDGMVARLAQAALANDPSTVLVIVSDHGFMNITHAVNLYIPFLQAGLIEATVTAGAKTLTVSSWKAAPWLAGGMAAIMLHDANDHETEKQVRALLDKLAADPENGIAAILDRGAIKRRGGFPDAAFLVVLKPGYYLGSGFSGNLVTPITGVRGSHGFSPEYPEMRASFFAMGAGIAHHRDLGVIDMRQIAPTVAKILKVSMPTAKAAPLYVAP